MQRLRGCEVAVTYIVAVTWVSVCVLVADRARHGARVSGARAVRTDRRRHRGAARLHAASAREYRYLAPCHSIIYM